MTRCLWNLSLVLASSIAVLAQHSQTPDAKNELNLGVAAYEKGAYSQAIQLLEHAVSLDPSATIGHFYLASAYDMMCIPDSCEPHWSTSAIQEYNKVLELDPNHKDALKSMAYLLYRVLRFDEAERFYRKAAKLDANDPEPLYSIAVLHFHRTYAAIMEEKARLHLAPKQPLIGRPACHQLRAKNLADVEEGIAMLSRTLELINDVEVQSYLAALYGERAELQCNDRSAYKRDLLSEQQWWNRACVTFQEAKRNIPPRWIAAPPPPPRKRGDTCR